MAEQKEPFTCGPAPGNLDSSATLLAFMIVARGADATQPRHWQPIRDDVFWQDIGTQASWPEPLTAVAVIKSQVLAGTAKGLLRLESGKRLFIETR